MVKAPWPSVRQPGPDPIYSFRAPTALAPSL